jgi:hypothetical protein
MNIKDAVKYVGSKFDYTSDKKGLIDYWFVMKDKETMKGDCDDFTITSFWYYNDRSLWKFIWNVMITHRCQIHRYKTINDGYHVGGCVDGLWFDNWTKEAVSEEEFYKRTGHKHLMRYYVPLFWLKLIVGYFVRR